MAIEWIGALGAVESPASITVAFDSTRYRQLPPLRFSTHERATGGAVESSFGTTGVGAVGFATLGVVEHATHISATGATAKAIRQPMSLQM